MKKEQKVNRGRHTQSHIVFILLCYITEHIIDQISDFKNKDAFSK